MKMYVVVVNYNSGEYTRKCIASLASAAIDEILVLDNASSVDQSAQLDLLPGLDPRVSVHYATDNRGFGVGVNSAVQLLNARPSDRVWILNPDMEVSDGAVAALTESLDEGVDITSPLILQARKGSDPKSVWFAGGSTSLNSGEVRHFTPRPIEIGNDRVVPTSFMTGAAPMMSVRTWQLTGGFREDLFMYWEDVDWSLRATALGLKMAITPRAVVTHEVGGSSGNGTGKSPLYYYYVQRNRIIVCATHGASVFGLLVGAGLRETLRLTLRPALRERRNRVSKLSASARGLAAGVVATRRLAQSPSAQNVSN